MVFEFGPDDEDEFSPDEEEAIRELAEQFDAEHADSNQVRDRKKANRAVVLLTDVVIDNKLKYQNDEDRYRKVVQAYCNILMYAKSKNNIHDVLDGIDGLDPNTKREIIRMSVPGKFQGFPRILHRQRVDEEYRGKFLQLLEVFAGTNERHDRMMAKLMWFAGKMQERKTLYTTGLLSALQQDSFIPYTTRSAWPLQNTPLKPLQNTSLSHMCDLNMKWYQKFNTMYRRISKYTGMTLLELDTVANQWWWNEN